MIRPVGAIFFFLIFSAQTFNEVVVVLDYYLNTASFAKDCENKARPMLHCNGKCQMMKKLKEQEKKGQQMPERKNENKNQSALSSSYFLSSIVTFNKTFNSFFVPVYLGNETKMPHTVFHPPCT